MSVPIPKITPCRKKCQTRSQKNGVRHDFFENRCQARFFPPKKIVSDTIFPNSSEPPRDDVLEHLAALQRALAEMALEDPAEEPARRPKALVVVERLATEREQLPPPVRMLVLDPVRGRSRPLLRVVQIAAVGTQRLAGLDFVIELEPVAERTEEPKLEQPERAGNVRRGGQIRKAVTIAGMDRVVRIAAGKQAQQELVRVVRGEQGFARERRGRAVRLDVGQRAELPAPGPREPQRRERLQQRAPAAAAAASSARDQPDAAVAGGHALEQLTRIAIRALVEDVASLEQHGFSVGHRNPSDVEAESLQLPLAVRPVLADLYPHLEMDAAAEPVA